MSKSNPLPNLKKDSQSDHHLITSPTAYNPISKLLANRPTAVESLVTKVEAITFEGVSSLDHHHHYHELKPQVAVQQQQQQQHPVQLDDHFHLNSTSNQFSPPYTSPNNSPPLNHQHHHIHHHHRFEDPIRDTPTFRQLKSSLRSRLNTPSSVDRRRQRSSEDSGKSSELSDHLSSSHTSSPRGSPRAMNSFLHKSQSPSITPSSTNSSNRNPSKDYRLPIPQRNLSSQAQAHLASTHSSFRQPSMNTSINQLSSSDLSSTLSHQSETQVINKSNRRSDGLNNFANPTSAQSATCASYSATSALLPELRVPLININLPPPMLALWSIQPHDGCQEIRFHEVIERLILLPLHTALAIMRKFPVLGHFIQPSTQLFQRAEQEKRSILITSTQIATGLFLAGGWKIARKILGP